MQNWKKLNTFIITVFKKLQNTCKYSYNLYFISRGGSTLIMAGVNLKTKQKKNKPKLFPLHFMGKLIRLWTRTTTFSTMSKMILSSNGKDLYSIVIYGDSKNNTAGGAKLLHPCPPAPFSFIFLVFQISKCRYIVDTETFNIWIN